MRDERNEGVVDGADSMVHSLYEKALRITFESSLKGLYLHREHIVRSLAILKDWAAVRAWTGRFNGSEKSISE